MIRVSSFIIRLPSLALGKEGHSSPACAEASAGKSRRRGEAGQTMIAMMVSIIIILILVLVLWGGPGLSQKQSVSTARQVTRKAQTVGCTMRLRDDRGMIVAEVGMGEGGAVNISQVIPPDELRCPISGLRYRFDPSRVSDGKTCGLWCPYPGHTGL